MNSAAPRSEGMDVRQGQTVRVLNYPLLIATFCVLLVVAPLAYAWHSYQSGRIGGALLDRAHALAEDEEWGRAAGYLMRYLQLNPDDDEVFVEFAETYDRSATSYAEKSKAISYYYRALGRVFPEPAEGEIVPPAIEEQAQEKARTLRTRLAELSLEIARILQARAAIGQDNLLGLCFDKYQAAATEAEKVVAASPDDAAANRILALARYGLLKATRSADKTRDEASVLVLLERALECDPGNIVVSAALADLYRDNASMPVGRLTSEWKKLFAAVDEGTLTQRELIARERIGKRLDRLAKTNEDVEELQKLFAGGGAINDRVADELLASSRSAFADDVMDRMLDANAQDPQAYLVRCRYRIRYALDGVDKDLDTLLEIAPDNVAGLQLAGRLAEGDREWDRARKMYQRIVEIAPEVPTAYVRLGAIMLAQRDPAEAIISHFNDALSACGADNLAINIEFARALILLGRVAPDEETVDAEDVLTAIGEKVKQLDLRPEVSRLARSAAERNRDFLWAMYYLARNNYAEAIPKLKSVEYVQGKFGAAELSEAALNFDLGRLDISDSWLQYQLARAYQALRQWDTAARTFEQAARDSAQPAFYSAAGESWLKAGQPVLAATNYEKALELSDAGPLWLGLARARFAVQAAAKANERNWESVEEAIAEAKRPERRESLSEPWRLALLEIDLDAARSGIAMDDDEQKEQVRGMVRDVEQKFPESWELLQVLIPLYEKLGFSDDADRILKTLEGKVPDAVGTRMSRAKLFELRGEYDQACDVLQRGLETASPALRSALQQEIARIQLERGDFDASTGKMDELSAVALTDISLIARLCEKALARRDLEAVEKWEDRLFEIEGEAGAYWRYYRGTRLLASSESANDRDFAKSVRLYEHLLVERPFWAETHLLGGMVFERQKALRRAADSYKKAIELGLKRVSIYERLVSLLYALQRYDEVDEIMALLKNQVPSSDSLSGVGIALAARRGQVEQGLRMARDAVKNRPEDPMTHIWLGHMCALNDQTESALSAYREAVRVAPDDLRPLNVLFNFQLRNGDKDAAVETLQTIAEKIPNDKGQREFALAQGYEQIGDRKQAESCYRTALEQAESCYEEALGLKEEEDEKERIVEYSRRFANFLIKSDPEEAEQVLEKAHDIDEDDRTIRRTLAAMLATRGGEKEWARISELLAVSTDDNPITDVDQRLQAILLARRGGKANLDRARSILEQMVADPKVAQDGDRLLLAQICSRDGDFAEARRQYLPLVNRAEPVPLHLALFVNFLLRFDKVEEAATYVAKLHDQEGAASEISTTALQARVLKAQAKAEEIGPLVEEFAKSRLGELEDEAKKSEFALAVGKLYSTVELHDAAEAWYRRAIETKPSAFASLATSLAKQGKVAEAIDVCRAASTSEGWAGPAIVLASMVVSGDIPDDEFEKAEAVFSAAAEEASQNPNLLSALATMRIVRGDTQQAIRLYRDVLKIQPKNVVVLNNLATLLAESSSSLDEALDHIDDAIEISGSQDALLDTKAMILFQQGKLELAESLLETACGHHEPDPRYLFHLAVVKQRLGKTDEAAESWDRAIELGLDEQILTGSDLRLREELERELKR